MVEADVDDSDYGGGGSRAVLPQLVVRVQSKEVSALIDTGSEITCVAERLWCQLRKQDKKLPCALTQCPGCDKQAKQGEMANLCPSKVW